MHFGIAFIGGIISFISPCILPLIPVYIAYISGISIKELKENNINKPFRKIFINSILFVLGFTLVFSILAALFYIFIQQLGVYKVWFNRIAGIILIIFGFHIMGIFTLPFLNYEIKAKSKMGKNSFLSSFIMGVVFGTGWTPCIGPILSGILFTSASSENPLMAVLQLIIYSLGLGIPFLLTGIAANKLLSFFEGLKKHYRVIEIISGIFLIILGLLLIFDWLSIISGLLSRLLPDLFNIEYKILK